jgi:uncharacterized protein (TIGR02172 family)
MIDIRELKMIGKGRTSEIYESSEDKVLKLFLEGFWEPAIEYEYRSMQAINEIDVRAPRCYEYVKVKNRYGILYQRIFGKSLLEKINSEPKKIGYYLKMIANEHYKIHKNKSTKLINQIERFGSQMFYNKEKIGLKYNELKRKLESMKQGSTVCHGDFHPDNIMINNSGCIVIDWMNCYYGSPGSDVMRTYLILKSPFLPDNVPEYIRDEIQKEKEKYADVYIEEYIKNSRINRSEILDWIDIVAAAKYSDEIHEEEQWLQSIIEGDLRY